jgi:hypothetical protein
LKKVSGSTIRLWTAGTGVSALVTAFGGPLAIRWALVDAVRKTNLSSDGELGLHIVITVSIHRD